MWQGDSFLQPPARTTNRAPAAFYWGDLPEGGVSGEIGVMQIAELIGPCQLKKSAQPHHLQPVTIKSP